MNVDATLARLRRTVDDLFPDAPPPPRVTARRGLVCGAIALLAIAIQIARMWPSKPLNSIWAEDGYIWLHDALTRDLLDALTTPYNGYLQTVSRLVAAPVSEFPVEWFAPAMALAGAAIVTGCAFLVWRASAGHIESPFLRAALASLVVLLPTVGTETLANVTNTIWFLVFAGFWILLWRPATLTRAAGAAAVLFVAAISTAGVLFLFPLWLLRLFAFRDKRDGVILAAFAAGMAIQLALSWDQTNLLGEAPGAQKEIFPHWSFDLVGAYVQRVIGGVVAGQWLGGNAWELFGIPFAVLLGIALAAFVAATVTSSNSRVRLLAPLAVVISVALFLVSGYRRWDAGASQLLWPDGISNTVGSHYVIAPTLLLLAALFVWLDSLPRSASATRPGIRGALAVLVIVAALLSFNAAESDVRGSPTWTEALDTARSQCESGQAEAQVLIAPNIAYVQTTMPLACDQLLDDP